MVARRYRERFVKGQIRKAKSISRKERFKHLGIERTTIVFQWLLRTILRELQPLLHCSDRCQKAIGETPMVVFRRPKSLSDYLVHAKLTSPRSESKPVGTINCGYRRCQVCNTFIQGTPLNQRAPKELTTLITNLIVIKGKPARSFVCGSTIIRVA